MNRKVIGHSFGIGTAQYDVYQENEARIIEAFLQSMNRQGQIGYWHKLTYAQESGEIHPPQRIGDAEIEKQVEEWLKRWPNHCKECGGWGGKPIGFDLCESIVPPFDEAEVCHRCGERGLDEIGQGPCTKCGWDDCRMSHYPNCRITTTGYRAYERK